jgi:hypothetical protein
MKYDVEIPDWTEGKPLHVVGIESPDPRAALCRVIDWVNRLAGYSYCCELPAGTKVYAESGALLLTLEPLP